MQRGGEGSRRFTAAWVILAAAFCLAIGGWSSALTRAVGPLATAEATPPAATSGSTSPSIVTDYTSSQTATLEALCGQLSPRASVVTVETPTGRVLETLDCDGGSNSMGSSWFSIPVPNAVATTDPGEPCINVQSPDGGQTVLSAKSGSLLTPAQAANCSP